MRTSSPSLSLSPLLSSFPADDVDGRLTSTLTVGKKNQFWTMIDERIKDVSFSSSSLVLSVTRSISTTDRGRVKTQRKQYKKRHISFVCHCIELTYSFVVSISRQYLNTKFSFVRYTD